MALDITTYKVEIELLEELLGTVPKNREVYSTYIAGKGREMIEKAAAKGVPLASGEQPNDNSLAVLMKEEEETIDEVEDRGWTGFHSDEEGQFLFDYALKGFLCEAARTLKERGNVKQLQDKFKRFVFVKPRRIRLPKTDRIEDYAGKPMLIVTDKGLVCERPLRAMTAQGPRVTVTRSDVIAAGSRICFTLDILEGGGITQKILRDVLDYGQYIGLGQWRSGGWGRFSVVSLEEV